MRARAQVTAEEMLRALAAVAGSDLNIYGGVDALSWLSGHLYQCPNGHVYTIGECGGAMQASRCPECGAVIGGGSHQLAGGNAPAIEALSQMRRAQGAR
jgi:hypothetical protein